MSRKIREFTEEHIRILEFLKTLDDIERKAAMRRVMIDSVVLVRKAREEH